MNHKESLSLSQKPHAVCIAFPVQSHIKATMKLAKLLHSRGFHITFVNNEFNHKRFLNSRGLNSLDGLPDFRFTTISDGLPPSDLDKSQDIDALGTSIRNFMIDPFRELVARLNDPVLSNGDPPVSCIVCDGMWFAINVAREIGVPSLCYWSFAAAGFMGFKQFRSLLDKGITPFKDESYLTNGYLETPFEVPGMKDIRLRDLPSFFRTTNRDDPMFVHHMEGAESVDRASALILHTFHALEPAVLAALNSIYPDRTVYPIGPMQLLLDQIEPSTKANLDSIGYSLWKEEPECLRWLDSRPPKSVIYVNFGSLTTMSKQHLVEFGMGLANSGVSFLWVIRPDLVTGESAALPAEFEEKAEGMGLISGWCPQEEVLGHPAVGGFLTHCGWGSMVESMICGVPVLCWPFFGDQPMNCRYACGEWGIGMEIDKEVKREAVEEMVRELMKGEKGEKMRKKAGDWAKLAREATGPGGSSTAHLDRLVNQLLQWK